MTEIIMGNDLVQKCLCVIYNGGDTSSLIAVSQSRGVGLTHEELSRFLFYIQSMGLMQEVSQCWKMATVTG